MSRSVSGILALSLFALSACSSEPAQTCRAASGHVCTWAGLQPGERFNGDGHSRLETAFYWPMDL
ncbi:MAG TPA: hypothetical protein VGJ84_08175, partial [Polyangiaceae bacterium]